MGVRPAGSMFIGRAAELGALEDLLRSCGQQGAGTALVTGEAGMGKSRLVDELCLDLSPVLLGEGLRLFAGIDRGKVALEVVEATHSPLVTHLRYAVKRP